MTNELIEKLVASCAAEAQSRRPLLERKHWLAAATHLQEAFIMRLNQEKRREELALSILERRRSKVGLLAGGKS